ncbi:MAG: uncharacterized protein KVP18_002263 [Porospora cf. gigantea A]|uniref:uncharacterized protein n=1 Tax=Porospora cf. gigantea A TaxID=2853593 RepID=UPI003559DDA6|nr:MAG: hypothetical protein KVP18_002263 [Porospora cf. gigantea A]
MALGVYLLQSVNRPETSYIGFTNQPKRRLRQHNREIKGGARKTATSRPWVMSLVVSGFMSTVQALQFEWSLNNPRRSRLYTTCPKKRKSFSTNVENCIRLLASPKFRALGLDVWLLEESARAAFRKGQAAQLVDTWPLVEMYEASFDAMLEGWPEVELEAGFEPSSACVVCSKDFLVERPVLRCRECSGAFHPACLARQSSTLVPDKKIECPLCLVDDYWRCWVKSRVIFKGVLTDACSDTDDTVIYHTPQDAPPSIEDLTDDQPFKTAWQSLEYTSQEAPRKILRRSELDAYVVSLIESSDEDVERAVKRLRA